MNPGRNPILRFGLALSALTLPDAAGAAKLVEGSFLATRECPAYVSKVRQTNPDDAQLAPGRIYPLFEINQDLAPDYYRIRIEGADPRERWVAADCGEYPPKSSPAAFAAKPAEPATPAWQCPPPPPRGKACRTCGKADGYVLALSWQPGLCQAKKTKSRDSGDPSGCKNPSPGSFAARNFSLRGLWPMQQRCGQDYGYCGPVAHEMKPFTAYPPLNLSEAGRQSLERIMPGVAGNSGLERHEWHKHGTCSGLPEEAYFKLAGDLTQQFNQSGMAVFMAGNLGKKIRREEFFQEIEAALGAGARKHINIECSADAKVLTGVVINLPGGLAPGAELKSLIEKAPKAGSSGNCGSRILLGGIGTETD